MKYLFLLLSLVFTQQTVAFGTCTSSYSFSIPSVVRTVYEKAGANTVFFLQQGGTNYKQITPIIYQQKLVVNLNTCSIAFSAGLIDPTNADFWLLQNYSLMFDPNTIDCKKEYDFNLVDAWVTGTTAVVIFTVSEIP